MKIVHRGQMWSKPGMFTADTLFLGRLRAASLFALLAGAAGFLGLMLRAGQRTPRLLLLIFVFWVLSPFAAFVFADRVSRRWSLPTRVTLHVMMLVVALGLLSVYVEDALRPRRAQAAFVYVVVPPASCLLGIIAIAAVALIPRRLSSRGDGT